MPLVIKEKQLLIGFLVLLVLLSVLFLWIKVQKHGEEISWDYQGDSSSSSSSEEDSSMTTAKPPKCVDSSPEATSEEGLTTPDPDPGTGEDGGMWATYLEILILYVWGLKRILIYRRLKTMPPGEISEQNLGTISSIPLLFSALYLFLCPTFTSSQNLNSTTKFKPIH